MSSQLIGTFLVTIFNLTISVLDIKINHNKNIQKYRSQILMQFVPLPLANLFRPTFCPLSLPQILAFSLATDFKKYCLALTLNELTSSQKEDKKSQNAETYISSLSLDEIIQGKLDGRQVQTGEKNRKKEDTVVNQSKDEGKVEKNLSRKRQCYQRARCQITQVFESSQQSSAEQEKSGIQERGDQIDSKDKVGREIKQLKEGVIRKQKKIRKGRKIQKVQQKVPQVSKFQISTTVSLIDTIDHPRITIDRFEIEIKREDLLSRAIVYVEFEQRKYSYQIRERRQLKKLN